MLSFIKVSAMGTACLALLLMAAVSNESRARDANLAQYDVRLGFLKCSIGSGWGLIFGSTRRVYCVYSGDGGAVVERYSGHIDSFGVDIGYRKHGIMLWSIFTTTSGFESGALAGSYVGVSADAALGVGVGGKILVGGFDRSFALQPISIEGTEGLNIAALRPVSRNSNLNPCPSRGLWPQQSQIRELRAAVPPHENMERSMKYTVLVLVVGAVLFATDGNFVRAAEVTEKQKCLGAIKVIDELKADEETPAIGDKAEAEVAALVEIATHLCHEGNFVYSGQLMEIARGMMVSE